MAGSNIGMSHPVVLKDVKCDLELLAGHHDDEHAKDEDTDGDGRLVQDLEDFLSPGLQPLRAGLRAPVPTIASA